jgi:CheY-like chemotaxis protein
MSKTVLVLDDEMLIALDIQSQLEELGHRVLVSSALSQALNLVESEPIDVAIVDWHLRDAISAPLLDLLKQRRIPFVLCSGEALEELAGLFPAAPILSKPFASNDLVGALDQVVPGGLRH